jgi:hypothetical protein
LYGYTHRVEAERTKQRMQRVLTFENGFLKGNNERETNRL